MTPPNYHIKQLSNAADLTHRSLMGSHQPETPSNGQK